MKKKFSLFRKLCMSFFLIVFSVGIINAQSTNVALNKPVTVDSEYNGTYVAEKAVDGNNLDNANRWLSANSTYPHWIEVNLQDPCSIDQVKFWTGYNGYGYAVEDYKIQYWTGSAWSNVVNVTGNSSATVSHTFSAVETDRVRLYATDGAVDNILRLYEIEVWGSVVTSGGALPSPWASGDIGAVAAAGDATYSSGTFTVAGSGADIWSSADEFRFVYQQVSGDGTITAKVNTLTNPNAWAKAGVMIRESLNANSANALSYVTPSNGADFQYRQSNGGTTVNVPGPSVTAPYWVRLQRSGNTITGYVSANGTSWTNSGSITVSMSSTYYVGLAVTSHKDGTLATATINNLVVDGSTGGGGDTQAPSVPTGLSANGIGQTGFTLSWSASTDNVGVTAYEVFKDGASIGTSTTTSKSVSGLTASTTYSMRVRARDAAGNWSAQSSALNVTTAASGGGGGDFPTPSTTGTSGTLTPHTGDITTTHRGQVIENLDMTGYSIHVLDTNVTIRNCKFKSLDIAVVPGRGLNCLVEDCELDWAGRQNFTLRRCYMTQNSTDLIRTGGPNVTIEDCYLLITAPIRDEAHSDIIQEYPVYSGANMVCRHNTMYNEISSTSCINISQGWTIDNNLMAGGSYSIYAWNATITDNHFSTIFFPKGGYNGIYFNDGQGSVCSGNVWHETGVPVNCGSSSAAEYVFTAKEEQQSVKLYPNPLNSNTLLYIQLNGYTEDIVNVEIFDLTGRSVYNQLHFIEQSELQLPVNNLKSGVYIVNINGNEVSTREKLVIE